MESSEFSFKLVSKSKIRCKKVNVRKVSAYIRSPDLLRDKKCNNKSKQY